MNDEKRPVSAGTLITLCLTVAVTVGCIFMFSKMSVEHDDVRLNAQRMIGLLESALSGPTPEPENHVRTVTVNPIVASADNNDLDKTIDMPSATSQHPVDTIQEYTFTATFGGILGFHSDISQAAFQQADQSFQYQPVLASLADYLTSDFNSAVLPHVINRESMAFTDVLLPASALDAIRGAGFDELVLNSEHTLDQGQQGAMDTINAVLERGFSCGGVNLGMVSQGRMMQLNSARIALFTYTEGLTESGEKNRVNQDGHQLINLFDLEKVRTDIANAKAQGANCILVFIHWGNEKDEGITTQQRSIAQALAWMGADAIIGSHPEKVMPIEMITTTGPDGESRNTLVAYSVGTLLSESREANAIAGMLLHLQITCNEKGHVTFQSIEYTPTYIWKQTTSGRTAYRVIASHQSPPSEMDQNQREVMSRALQRVQETLANSPVYMRNW